MTATPVSTQTKQLAQELRKQEIAATSPIDPSTRCDRFESEAAQARITTSNSEVYLCVHHLREHFTALDGDPRVTIHLNPGVLEQLPKSAH